MKPAQRARKRSKEETGCTSCDDVTENPEVGESGSGDYFVQTSVRTQESVDDNSQCSLEPISGPVYPSSRSLTLKAGLEPKGHRTQCLYTTLGVISNKGV